MIIYYTSCIWSKEKVEVNLNFPEPKKILGINPQQYGSALTSHNVNLYSKCPAYNSYFKNLFTINSQIDYDLFWNSDKTEITTNHRDQNYFNKLINIRSIEEKLFSLQTSYLFIPECDDLYVTQENCKFESNSFINNTILIPGTFNIAKWPRPIDIAFHITGDGFTLKQNDPLYTLRFHTKEKIQFKRFLISNKMTYYVDNMIDTGKNFKRLKDLQVLYDIFFNQNKKYKSLMLKEAKNNLLD